MFETSPSAEKAPSDSAGGTSPPPANAAWRPGFWSLILTQFQTGFNDNAVKFLVIYIVVAMNFPEGQRDFLILVIGAMFALPFILFSMAGGYFADRYSKRSVTIGTKILECAILGFFIVALRMRSIPMECAAVFLISTEGALFGPSKYGLLPELLPEPRLSWGNGIIELGTFAASIGATMAAGILAEHYHGREPVAGLFLLAFGCVGFATSFGISRVPAADPQRAFRWNPLGDFGSQLRVIRADKVLSWAVLGNTYLWFLAALLQFTIVVYGHDMLRADDAHISYLQAAVGIGIGIGSFAAGYLSCGKIEYGLIPLGALGMTVFGALLYSPGHSMRMAGAHLALLGFFGGFFAVPLNALIQHRPRPDKKGGVIAAANLLSFVGVFAAAGAYYLFSSSLHQSPAGIFLDGALLTLITTAYSIYLLPDSLVRLVLWIATHSVYRIRVEGRDNIPETGGALFVANHMSLVDALLLIASTDRSIRFLIFKDIYDLPLVKPFAKLIRAIPISSELRPREMLRSLHQASNTIRSGEVVCIFAEGEITRIGQLLPFRRGMERIMKGVDAPIVPVNLDGVWGSIFSFERGRFLWKMPRLIPYPVTISFGKPLPPTTTSFEVREAVQQLHNEAYAHHKEGMRTLHRGLIHTAHRSPFRFAMGDTRRPRMKWGGVLLSSIFLARRLRGTWAGQEMVGILLPPSAPGALVNFAAALAGKIPVNLNYTASNESLASCAEQCKLETVITTRLLLDHIRLQVPGKTILLEEAAAAPRLGEKIFALLLWFLPGAWIEGALSGNAKKSVDDLAAIIFSSGSTGDPKGVMLTHYNIASNIEQAGQTFMFDRKDCMLGVLPFFHPFGFTVTLWLPAALGISVVYHPSPLDLGTIGELVRDYRITFLLTTPAFLQKYTRHCSPEDFRSLQWVVVAAEKLPERLAIEFEDRFGIRPLEAYGTTECSPIVSVNTHDFRAPGFHQVGAKRGHMGRPLPGVSVRIVDPDTHAPLPVGRSGLLLVRGPNVMQGYLGKPEWTTSVLREGWYITGDMASQDPDGFLTITDRLSQFSKIGGEMVPHRKMEDQLHELVGSTEQCFAVTPVPDGNKGERLVVLHTLAPDDLQAMLDKLSQAGLPHRWSPRQFFPIEELPHLGTGQLDLRRIRAIALALCSVQQE
ncbi:MAG: acyl-[ACP]--phospholipid O-acyltransferase [Candidatus Acidiferrales bacterium]|jgi:acyl-[acyl-carrier-protein]-phospholipid O-acyltransferase/long-chain-fatty-acid--[acyl-carrier-protein] ligase